MKNDDDTDANEASEVKIEYDAFGFVKKRLCPHCHSEKLKPSHVDDIGTEWLKCENCGCYCTKAKTLERKELEEALAKPINAVVEFPQKYFEEGTFVPKLLAEEIMAAYNFITLMDTDEVYAYIEGYYQHVGEALIKKECRARLGSEYRKNRASEVVDFIKASTYTNRRDEPPYLLPLSNGILDLRDMQLKPHSPEYMFFNKLPVKYDPNADCPNIKRFLSEITSSQQDIDILTEIVGFCLYREYTPSKALMLVGDGANGKSTFLNLVKAFLGNSNVSSRSLQEIEGNRFAKADLQHKFANIYADLPDQALFSTGTFKMLTGRDLITAEKKFMSSFQFVNYAKLLFSANKVPEAYDDSEAFFRRWIIIVFPNKFEGDKADPRILEKLTTEEELSGLLNLALQALKRLLERGQFSHSQTTEEVRLDYIRKSSPIAAFAQDALEIDPDAFIIKKDLFSLFAVYCRSQGLPTVGQDTFFKNLPKHIVVADFRPKLRGQRPSVFKGIRLNPSVSRVFTEISQKEAQNMEMSDVSTVSRVTNSLMQLCFYAPVNRQDEYEQLGYRTEVLPNESYIKICIALDTPDTVDISKKNGYFNESGQITLDTLKKQPISASKSLAEKLELIKTWLVENKDSNGLVDYSLLAAKIHEFGLDVQRIVQLLKDEFWLREVPSPGKLGVK